MNNAELLSSLTPEELQNLINVAQNFQLEGSASYQLPQSIYDDLESTSTKDRKSVTAKFIKRLNKYDGGSWTRGGATNKELINELKRCNIDANQLVQQLYKDGEKIRHSACAATELFDDIESILEEDDLDNIKQHLSILQQKCQVLAVYGYSTAKNLDDEAKRITTANIKLPTSMRSIISTEEEDKELVFSQEEMQYLHNERFRENLLKKSSFQRGQGNGNGNGNGYGYGRKQTRGGKQFNNRYNSRENFFGKHRQHQSNHQSNNQYNNNSSQQSNQQQQQQQSN
jgi:hypothetical protein